MLCRLDFPVSFSHAWQETQSGKGGRSLPLSGVGFCSRKDQWKSQTGRHRALTEALKDDLWIESSLREEIVAAFTAEEARRTKVKGPARQPKTYKPKSRRPGLREALSDLQQAVEELADNIRTAGKDSGWRQGGSVHHLDGDPNNNAIDNLIMVDTDTTIRPAHTSTTQENK